MNHMIDCYGSYSPYDDFEGEEYEDVDMRDPYDEWLDYKISD